MVTSELNSIRVEEVIELFNAKGKDRGINVYKTQLLRFVERVRRKFTQGKLNLSRQYLGYESAIVISNIISNE